MKSRNLPCLHRSLFTPCKLASTLLPAALVLACAGCADDYISPAPRRYVTTAPAERVVLISRLPPRPRREVSPPPAVGRNSVWVAGHWSWRNNDWVWIAGQEMPIPYPSAVWIPGRYVTRNGAYYWEAEHWTRARARG